MATYWPATVKYAVVEHKLVFQLNYLFACYVNLRKITSNSFFDENYHILLTFFLHCFT